VPCAQGAGGNPRGSKGSRLLARERCHQNPELAQFQASLSAERSGVVPSQGCCSRTGPRRRSTKLLYLPAAAQAQLSQRQEQNQEWTVRGGATPAHIELSEEETLSGLRGEQRPRQQPEKRWTGRISCSEPAAQPGLTPQRLRRATDCGNISRMTQHWTQFINNKLQATRTARHTTGPCYRYQHTSKWALLSLACSYSICIITCGNHAAACLEMLDLIFPSNPKSY